MAEGKCDCCGKGLDLLPVGVPMGSSMEGYDKLYFLCKPCLMRLPESAKLSQEIHDLVISSEKTEDWEEENE